MENKSERNNMSDENIDDVNKEFIFRTEGNDALNPNAGEAAP